VKYRRRMTKRKRQTKKARKMPQAAVKTLDRSNTDISHSFFKAAAVCYRNQMTIKENEKRIKENRLHIFLPSLI
jgi:hypothetical protein